MAMARLILHFDVNKTIVMSDAGGPPPQEGRKEGREEGRKEGGKEGMVLRGWREGRKHTEGRKEGRKHT